MIWRFTLLALAQVPLAIWCARLLARQGIGFFLFFYAIFVCALMLPFAVISFRQFGWFNLTLALGVPDTDRVMISFGDGFYPALFVLLMHTCFVIGAMAAVALTSKRSTPISPIPPLEDSGWKKLQLLTFCCLGVAMAYIAVRALAVPDFPLFVMLKGEKGDSRVRDLSYAYSSSRAAPWLFLPSIHSQFYRILLPLSSFVLFVVWHVRRQRWILVCAVIAALIAVAMAYGTMKRTPLVYLAIWIVCWACMYRRFTARMAMRIGLAAVLVVGLMTLITSGYGSRSNKLQGRAVYGNLVYRIVYGEATAEYLAIEHHPRTFPHRGINMFSPYLAKMFGDKQAESFSQVWKQQFSLGTGRGFDAVGVFTEFFVAYGWFAAALAGLLLGAGLVCVDCRLAARGLSKDERPFIAGLMTIVAAIAVKGTLTQIFTGGAFTLLAAYAIWRYYRTRPLPLLGEK